MIQRISAIVLVLFSYTSDIISQQRQLPKDRGVISGKIFDFNDRVPVEYANIILFNSKDSSLVTGTVTDKSGSFKLSSIPEGKYYLNIQFIGYEKRMV